MTTKQSVELTESNYSWLAAQAESGKYRDESAVINDLIRRERCKEGNIEAIRAGLKQAETSIAQHGYSRKSVEQIWHQAKEAAHEVNSVHDGS